AVAPGPSCAKARITSASAAGTGAAPRTPPGSGGPSDPAGTPTAAAGASGQGSGAARTAARISAVVKAGAGACWAAARRASSAAMIGSPLGADDQSTRPARRSPAGRGGGGAEGEGRASEVTVGTSAGRSGPIDAGSGVDPGIGCPGSAGRG